MLVAFNVVCEAYSLEARMRARAKPETFLP